MKVEKAYKIDNKIIERGMILKVVDGIAKQGSFIDIIDFLGQKVMRLDCSVRYNSCIIDVNVAEIEYIEIVEQEKNHVQM